jgi:hypothetical protein
VKIVELALGDLDPEWVDRVVAIGGWWSVVDGGRRLIVWIHAGR